MQPFQESGGADNAAPIEESLPGPVATVTDGRIREQEFKDFESGDDRLEKKVRARARGKLYYRYKNAESGFDILERVGGFFNQLRFGTDTWGSISGSVRYRCAHPQRDGLAWGSYAYVGGPGAGREERGRFSGQAMTTDLHTGSA